MRLTRMVRIAENVLVLPLSLWTTPLSSPRTRIRPSFLRNFSGKNLPVTLRPLRVVPTTVAVMVPFALWATFDPANPSAAAGACAARPEVALPPEVSAIESMTANATTRATGFIAALVMVSSQEMSPKVVG